MSWSPPAKPALYLEGCREGGARFPEREEEAIVSIPDEDDTPESRTRLTTVER
jgi:hypothetical protein